MNANEDIPDGSVDFCFSVTVLEHIDAFEDTFALLHRKMRKGVDHVAPGRLQGSRAEIPFRFYAHSISEWRDKKMGTNLLRINDMKTIFEHIGSRRPSRNVCLSMTCQGHESILEELHA